AETSTAASNASPFTMLYMALACLILVIVFETILIQKMMKLIAEQNYKLVHAHDGIHELDNQMPPWLQYIFAATIVFAAIYLFVYQVSGIGKSPTQEYAAEMQQATMQKEATLKTAAANIDESSVLALKDEASLSMGKSIFIVRCSP